MSHFRKLSAAILFHFFLAAQAYASDATEIRCSEMISETPSAVRLTAKVEGWITWSDDTVELENFGVAFGARDSMGRVLDKAVYDGRVLDTDLEESVRVESAPRRGRSGWERFNLTSQLKGRAATFEIAYWNSKDPKRRAARLTIARKDGKGSSYAVPLVCEAR